MPVQVQAPDGTIAQFPDGMSDTDIQAVMAREYAPAAAAGMKASPAPGIPQPVTTAMQPKYPPYDPASNAPIPGVPLPDAAPNPQTMATDLRSMGESDFLNSYGIPKSEAAARLAAQQQGAASQAALLNAQGASGRPATPIVQAQDAVRSIPGGLRMGAVSLGGMPGDLRDLALDGVAHAVSAGSQLTDGWDNGVGGKMSAATYDQARAMVRAGIDGNTLFPTSQQAMADNEKMLGPTYIPQTKAGVYAQNVASYVPAVATGGEGLWTKGAMAIGGGVASQAAGDLTAGTPYEPWARFVGSVVGTGAPASLGRSSKAMEQLSGAVRNATPEDLQAAHAIMANGADQGIYVPGGSALDYVSNGRTNAARIQNLVEKTKEGQLVMAPKLATVPAAARAAVTTQLDRISPVGAAPAVTGLRGGAAANQVLQNIKDNINASAGPLYEQLPGAEVSDSDYSRLLANQSYRDALKSLRSDPEMNNAFVGDAGRVRYSELPDTDAAVLNRVSQILSERADQVRIEPGQINPQGSNIRAGLRGGAKTVTDDLGAQATPAYPLARETVETGYRAFHDPLANGPLGRIARGQDQLAGESSALFGGPSYDVTPFTQHPTAQALSLMNAVDPGAGNEVLRQHLGASYNQAAGLTAKGQPNYYGPAAYVKLIAGDPIKRQAVLDSITATSGKSAAMDFADLLDSMAATGNRGASGGTALTNIDIGDAERAPTLGGKLVQNLEHVPGFQQFGEWAQRARLGKGAEDIAKIFTAPPDKQIAAIKKAQVYKRSIPQVVGRGLVANAPAIPVPVQPQ